MNPSSFCFNNLTRFITRFDKSSLTTKVMVMKLKHELTELKEIIQRMKWNILKFNKKVNMIVLNLNQQGAKAQDLVHQTTTTTCLLNMTGQTVQGVHPNEEK